MEIRLKNIELDKENRQDAIGFGNTIDLYMKRIHELEKLRDGNISDIEFCKKIFSMYEIKFDKDYTDVIKYLNAKKGIILTNVPHYCNGAWTLLSYEIAYYELDLEHVYIEEEVSSLVKGEKILLLSSKPYISTTYEDSFNRNIALRNQLRTLEDYDFSNLSNNEIENNKMIVSIIKNLFKNYRLKEDIEREKNKLLEMLQKYKEYAVQMKQYCTCNIDRYNQLEQVCNDKIKKLCDF